MEIYLEQLITPTSFMEFEIGNKLNLPHFKMEEEHAEPGWENDIDDSAVAIEVAVEAGRIASFDIILQHQENELYLGSREEAFKLNDCGIDGLLSFLNLSNYRWQFKSIIGDNCISIACQRDLQLIFYFDCQTKPALRQIHIDNKVNG